MTEKYIKLKIYDDGECIFMMKYQELLRLDNIKPGDIIGQTFSMDLSLHYEPETGMGSCYSESSDWLKVTEVRETAFGLLVKAIYLGDKVDTMTPCISALKIKPATKKEIMEHIEKCFRCRDHLKSVIQ